MNEEYLSYVDYLKSINFEHRLEIMKEKYEGKKIILFGMGLLLDAILDNYDVKKYLNVIGISDKKVVEDKTGDYKGFNLYKPLALRALNFNVVLDTNIMFEKTRNFLSKNYYIKKNVVIEKIIQISFTEKLENFFEKIEVLFKFLITSKSILDFLNYSFIC